MYTAEIAVLNRLLREIHRGNPVPWQPGGGVRFAALRSKLAKRRGRTHTGRSRKVRDPAALAAWIGRRKYGKARFQQMAAAGQRRKARRK